MSTTVYINLPAKDLAASREFYSKLFTINEEYSNEMAVTVTVNEGVSLIFLTHDFFKSNTKLEIADTSKVAQVTNAFEVETREEVDKLVDTAIAAGAKEGSEATEADGMYIRSFNDLDGHHFDVHAFL